MINKGKSLFKVLSQTAANYLRNSSINGLSHAARAKTLAKKIYWMILVVVGGLLTSYSIYDIICEFNSYPVATSNEIQKNSVVQFPAVTICNLNRIHCRLTFDRLESLHRWIYHNKNPDQSRLRTNKKDMNMLKDIMSITGCAETICEEFKEKIKSLSKTKSSLYISLGIYCDKTKDFDCKATMSSYDGASFIGKERILEALSKQKCNVKTICYFDASLSKKDICSSATLSTLFGAKKTLEGNGQENITQISTTVVPQYNNIDANFQKEDEFNELFFELSEKTRRIIGHPMHQIHSSNWKNIYGFIINCSFKGNSCNNEKYWQVNNIPCCGNCFTFNTVFNERDEEKIKNVSFTGFMHGLSLELYLNQNNYMKKGLSRKAGAVVVIHDSASFPQIEEFGLQIQPSTATSISMEKKVFNLMPHPYQTDCISFWNETKLYENIITKNVFKYSLEACQKVCFQLQLIKRCKCQHVHLYTSLLNDSLLTEDDDTPLRTCSSIPYHKNADFICHQTVQKEYDEGLWKCGCENPCQSTSYRVSMSTSDWPSDFYMPIILKKTNQKPTRNYIDGLLRKRDYVRVDVYFESLNVETITASPKFTVDSYFAALGGALSFYLGIAIIMMFEGLELVFDVFVTFMKELGKKNESNNSSRRLKVKKGLF